MLTPVQIIDAVEELLTERFPGEPVYRNITPVGFVRPSFLVAFGPQKMQDASCGVLELETAVTVSTFCEVDEYGNSHVNELLRRMIAVQELYAVEGLRVSDRVLHVISNSGLCHYDYAEVTVVLNYRDDRPTTGEWPLMGEVELAMVAE